MPLSTICRIIRSQVEVPCAVLKVLLGIAIGGFIYANPEVRQITADLLRATVDALAPAVEDRTLEGRINAVLVGK